MYALLLFLTSCGASEKDGNIGNKPDLFPNSVNGGHVFDSSTNLNSKKYDWNPTWDSLDSRPLPEWYDKAKFGIFIHWGVYAVPAMGEWFWYNWKGGKNEYYIDYVEQNYKKNFSYQDFAPMFTAENFDPVDWVNLFDEAGAKYVVLTSKHHEGYTMWPSKYSFSWNSMDVGPHRDIVGQLAKAVRKYSNMTFGLYHSLYEWFNPLYLEDKENDFKTQRFVDFKSLAELYELVEEYKPEIIWSDGEWEVDDWYWRAKDFLAWLYNKSPVRDTVVVNDRWGGNTLCKHGGFLTCADRYQPGKLQNRKWENALTIDKYSWGYRKSIDSNLYYTTRQLIWLMVETVSYGGNFLLNVGPTSYGVIPQIQQDRLRGVGKWLAVNGKAIYETVPWIVCQNESSSLVRYTRGNAKETACSLFAAFSEWPFNSELILTCVNLKENATMKLLGYETEIKWQKRQQGGISVTLPDKAIVDYKVYQKRSSTDGIWVLEIDYVF